ncbi:MAG: RHS repeat-associated core domain-containing protein, partial [Pseudomonadota bacterium]|nr:RHS repeat-associated core domain-containing protein [Pseudomonadota bacterium]
KTGNGQTDYLDRSGNHDQLTRVDAGNGYDIRRKDQTVYRYRIYSVNPWPGTPPEEWFLQDNTKLLLIDITDWKGNRLTFYREAAYGTIEEVRDNMGRKLEFDYYSPAIQLREVKEVVGGTTKRSISFTYNSDGLLETFTDANGRTTRYAYYDEPATLRHNLLKSVTYPKGNTVTVHYDDATGQVDSIKDNDVSGSTITYTPSSNLTVTEVEDPEHNKYNYIHTGNLLTAFKGANEARRVTIDRTDSNNPNLPTKVTDKKGYTTEYEYDAMGNVTKIINDDGMVATFSYNDKNNIISSREFHDPNGTTPPPTTYTYQIDGNRLWRVTNPENETVELGYDANHQLTSVTDGRGYTTQFAYDSYGNLEQVTDAEGNTTVYENDYAGRVTSVTDAEGIKTAITYDANDNPLDVMNYARGEQTVLRTVSRLYDFNGNLDSVSWLNQGTSSQTRYTYDSQDRLHKVIKPGNLDKVFTHYETGLVKTRSDYNNDTTTYYYDDHNRLERTRYPDQTETTIIRDLNGNVTSVTGRNGTSSFTYDNLNRVETYTDPYNKTVQYDYDNAGRVSKITYPGSNEVDYTYDNAGRLETVTDWNNGSVTYVYDATGNLKEIQRSNGITTVYTYDRASRLTGITEKDGSTMLWSYTFELDGVGNHNAVDVVNEPLAFTAASEEVTYTNDRTNNRLLSAGSTSYTYDDNGNRKTSTEGGVTTTYTWDYENMLTGISTPGQTNIQHVYDAMGNRITRVVDGITARYVLDLNSDMSRVLAETHGSGVVTAYYIYGHGLISRIDASDNTRRFYHFNHRGDTVVLSDDSGTVNDEYAYGEYGQVQESPTNTTPNPFRYVGQYGVMDEGQNLYFMRARFYDPEIGRFLNEDPLGFEGGDWNLYAYVMGNPGTATDPLGLMDFGGMWKSAVDRAGKYADEALNWSAKRIEDAAQHVDRRLEELSLWRGRESGKGVGGCQELPYQTSTNIQFICVPMIGGAEEFPAYAVATLYVSGKRTIYDQTSPANMRNTIRAIRSGEAGEALRNSIRKGMEHWNDFWYPNGNPFRR